MPRLSFVLVVLLAACAAPVAGRVGVLDAALAELLARPELAGGRIGVQVVDAAANEVLVSADADRGFATASNMKLVSAAVALTTLGPEHRMPTELWWRGDMHGAVWSGELVLRGHGDPTLGRDTAGAGPFAALVAALRERGVQRIVGRVVGDDGWLGTEHLGLGWQWDYLDEDYAAPFGGLCCLGNVVALRVRPGAGEPVVVVEPPWYPVLVDVRQGEAGTGERLLARRALGAERIVLTGAIAADAKPQTLLVTVPDPAAFAARALVAALRAGGIEVEEQAVLSHGEAVLVGRTESPPLAAIVQPMLANSDNLCAEQVARVAARVATGDGSTTSMAKHAAGVLASLGVGHDGMVIADGSGLSRRNLVQPRQLAGVLLAMLASPHRAAFVAGLPLAGRSGTLRNRFRDGPAHGRVLAKTGFISRVVCLSGYVPRPEPGSAPLVFSIMLNDFTCGDDAAKAAADAFVQRLAAFAGW